MFETLFYKNFFQERYKVGLLRFLFDSELYVRTDVKINSTCGYREDPWKRFFIINDALNILKLIGNICDT